MLLERKEGVRRLGRLILIDLADQSCKSWKGTTAWATGLFAQGLYEVAPLGSYISIKIQGE